MVKIKDRHPVLCEKFENEKKKGQNFLNFWSGDLKPRFSVILPDYDLSFSWKMRVTRSNIGKELKIS